MQWYLTVLRRYADFNGRARRREYWMFTLINGIVTIVLQIVDVGVGFQLGDAQYGVLSTVYGLAVLVPGLAVTARRLHDIDRSGWWQLMPFAAFVPLALVIVLMGATSTSAPPTALIVAFVAIIVTAIAASLVVFAWTVTDGKLGPNRFGPNPKEPVTSQVW